MTARGASNNSVLDWDGLPPFDRMNPDDADAAVSALLDDARKALAELPDAPEPTWENTAALVEVVEERVARVWGQIEHMRTVDSPKWSAVHERNLEAVAGFHAELGLDERLYAKFGGLRDSPAFGGMTAARRHAVERTLRDFALAGVALPPDGKSRFRKVAEELAGSCARYSRNLLDATNGFTLLVEDEGAVADLPRDVVEAARRTAGTKDGKGLRFTLLAPSYVPFMRFCPRRSWRQMMHRAYATRASELGDTALDNTDLVSGILTLKAERAALLGFASHADYALQTRMASDPREVKEFIRELVKRARPQAERELAELRDFAADELGIPDLQAWDIPFAAERLRRSRYGYDENELRRYFQRPSVLTGLFGVLSRVFGVDLEEDRDAPVWAPGVQVFLVRDRSGGDVGRVYLDLSARESKRSGAWMADGLSRFRANDGLQLPSAYVNCNFSPPSPGQPELFGLDEVEVLFHEFGHAIHHVLAEPEDFSVSGMNGVEWDAVELPSQFLENFVWDRRVMKSLSCHADTGAEIPDELFDKVDASRRFHGGLWLIRQLEFALFDMELHSAAQPPDVRETLARVRSEVSVIKPPEYDRFYCGFDHIFGGGYSAGYYSYLWAEVLSTDAFEPFAGADAETEATEGLKFRREILAAGGSRPAMESFLALRGRRPNLEPLLRHYGIPVEEGGG